MYPALTKYNAPPSPPETHSSYFSSIPAHSAPARAMATPGSSFDNGTFAPAPMEIPTSRFRRGSSIGYISTPGHSHREARERTGSMASKFLVIVVPPSSVAQEHGNLGHTLSMGPGHRLSQGLIMPLFPTMYGQLTAIAREFNFPSSAGICLYYCFSEHGITMTPRLSDDIWPTIWGLSDPSQAASERRSPIAGKLEFDIDMTQARWYTAWLSSRHRELTDPYAPATAPNLQFRGERKFTFPPASEDESVDQEATLRSAPVMTRHVPRKLSLIDRYDSAQPEPRLSRPSHSPPTGLPLSSHVLSPITQQEEPQSARLNLNDRVKSWRASAIVNSPVEIPSSEPSALEIAESPAAVSPASQSSFHMEDYAFSISSAGPDDRSSVGSYYQDYLPSVHMCDRVNGSVCMTESDCTSAGPMDDEFYYNFEVDEDSRVLTPDIAHCMFEEAPATPVTATSWGAPSPGPWSLSSEIEYSPSVDLGFRAQFSAAPSPPSTATSWGASSVDELWSAGTHRSTFSVHLGDRGEFTAPPTPQTATSWGAPSPGPFSPASPFRLSSPDVAHRQFDDANDFERRAALAAAWRPPVVDEAEGSVDATASRAAPSSPVQIWAHSWPYRKAEVSLKTVAKVVSAFSKVPKLVAPPKGRKKVASASTTTPATSMCSQYPSFVLYAPVYPHFDLYPAVAGSVAPVREDKVSTAPCDVGAYPFFRLYAPVYPNFDLYPGVAGEVHVTKTEAKPKCAPVVLPSAAQYPSLQIYAPAYPHFDLYPGVAGEAPSSKVVGKPKSIPVVHSSVATYPSFQIYAPVYPHFDLYPATAGERTPVKASPKILPSPTTSTGYPYFQLYKPVYPYFDLYPSAALPVKKSAPMASQSKESVQLWNHSWPYRKAGVSLKTVAKTVSALQSTRASVLSNAVQKPAVSTATPRAPAESSSASVKPWNQSWPYRKAGPSMDTVVKSVVAFKGPLRKRKSEAQKTDSSTGYPHFNLYPPVATTPQNEAVSLSTGMGYPSFVIYPAVYPHNLRELYPGPALDSAPVRDVQKPKAEDPLAALASYPNLCIYRRVYPHNLKSIYPPVQRQESVKTAPKPVFCKLDYNVYPVIQIYSLVYPHNVKTIYPGLAPPSTASRASSKPVSMSVSNSYPSLVVYPVQYPFFDLYPAPAASRMAEVSRSGRSLDRVSTKLVAHYPCFDLYPPVYPHFSLWPSTPALEVKRPASSAPSSAPLTPRARKTNSGRLTHSELHAMVMMEQNIMKTTLPITTTGIRRRPSTGASSPAKASPVKRVGSVRFENDISPRRTRPPGLPSRASVIPPRTSPVEPQRELPPVPTSTLARSSTLPTRRPQLVNTNPAGRQSLYSPETMRSRGLRHNTMSIINLDKTSSPIARRLTVWENVAASQTTPAGTPTPPAPSIKQAARRRDSLVIQRIKAFDAQHFTPASS